MKMLILLTSLFALNLHAYKLDSPITRNENAKLISKTPQKKWSCPPGSKFSKIGGDEPYCQIGYKLTQVPGSNIPKGYGCFACKSDGIIRPYLFTK